MIRLRGLIAALLVAFLITGCSKADQVDLGTEMPAADGQITKLEYSLYLPDDAPYEFNGEIEKDQTIFLEEIVCTNTTQIKIKNKGDAEITCELFAPDDLTDSLLVQTIKPGKSNQFTGLTSAMTYCIGFQSEKGGTIEVIISG